MSVVLVVQHLKRMRRIILSFVATVPVPYCFTLSHKRHDFREIKLLNMKSVLIFFRNLV